MDIDVASALNCLTAREKAVLIAFLQLSPNESGENVAETRFGGHIDRDDHISGPTSGLSREGR